MRCNDTFLGRFLLSPLCPPAKYLFRKILKVRVTGLQHLPGEGAYIVASNHRSYLDPPVLNSVFPEPLIFLAKEELFKPPLGWIIRHMRALPIKRGARDLSALELAMELLRKGCKVALFPEGTRAKPGEFLRPKPGIGFLAIKSGVPVVPVLVEGTDKVFPRGAKLPRPGHPVKVVIGKPRRFVECGEGPEAFRKVSLEIMESIKELSSLHPS